ncbi:MAG: hypothetical protein O3C65_08195 [Proteobacteria bacterium]|nr:hypothetical protein [Pseudomonadota bacterium]MDA1058654.1 hypothetical protein [Pseudomonadota bacterium]
MRWLFALFLLIAWPVVAAPADAADVAVFHRDLNRAHNTYRDLFVEIAETFGTAGTLHLSGNAAGREIGVPFIASARTLLATRANEARSLLGSYVNDVDFGPVARDWLASNKDIERRTAELLDRWDAFLERPIGSRAEGQRDRLVLNMYLDRLEYHITAASEAAFSAINPAANPARARMSAASHRAAAMVAILTASIDSSEARIATVGGQIRTARQELSSASADLRELGRVRDALIERIQQLQPGNPTQRDKKQRMLASLTVYDDLIAAESRVVGSLDSIVTTTNFEQADAVRDVFFGPSWIDVLDLIAQRAAAARAVDAAVQESLR